MAKKVQNTCLFAFSAILIINKKLASSGYCAMFRSQICEHRKMLAFCYGLGQRMTILQRRARNIAHLPKIPCNFWREINWHKS